MITASHNPLGDNGIKLIDPSGEMLPPDCERELTELINASDDDFVKRLQAHKIRNTGGAHIRIGSDTRPSSKALVAAAEAGCQLGHVPYTTHGITDDIYKAHAGGRCLEEHTTPHLHFIVRAANDASFDQPENFVRRFREALCDFKEVQWPLLTFPK